jgi:hypothetical protein
MLLGIPFHVRAAPPQDPEARGLEIAVEADRRDDGFKDFTAEMNMTLKNRRGDESVRILRIKNLEVAGDGDKSLTIFDNPRDIKGTAFLTFTHKSGPDDQWLYLPALNRVKRISSSNKSGSFMGSEFAYEDLSSQEIEKYTYKWIKDEPCPGDDYKTLGCFVIERYPVDPNSGYTRQVVWIDTDEYRTIKVDYFDRKNAPLKTLTLKGYKQYLNKFWRADEMYVINHQTKKSTLLEWKDYKFRTGLKNRDFHKNALKRAR